MIRFGGRHAMPARRAYAAFAFLVFLGLPVSSATRADKAGITTGMKLFGYDERASPNIASFPKWTGVVARHAKSETLQPAFCTTGPCFHTRWFALLRELAGREAGEQLRAINAFVNQVPFVADSNNYGVVDYWATPAEFFAKGGD